MRVGHRARTLTRARVLLKAHCSEGRAGRTGGQVGAALDVGRATVERIRQRFVEESFETALYSRRRGRRHPHRLDGEAEAHLVAPACSSPPGGRARWATRLLAGRLVESGVVESVSREAVRGVPKKGRKPWLVKQWCIPPEGSAAFVAAMEDVPGVYPRASDPLRPQVCMGEKDYYLPILRRGAVVQFDLIGWREQYPLCPTDEDRAQGLAGLVRGGYADRLTLSTDTCRLSQLHANGGRGFDYLWQTFLPLLRGRGVENKAIDQMPVDNPRRLASIS